MISPFMLYLVLMLDSINSALLTAAVIAGVSIPISLTITGMNNENDTYNHGWEDRREARIKVRNKLTKMAAPIAVVCFIIATLLPNTKQAAAIIVVPAIANNEQVQAEAGELYDLAKQALANAVAPSTKEKTE